MNDLHSLHNKTDEAFARRLFNALPAMCCGPSDISQAIQSDAGISPLRADTAEIIDTRRDSGGGEGQGVRVAV